MTAPSQQNKLAHTELPLLQMQQDWILGTKMPQWQATSAKECTSTKECTPTGSQHGKSRCPPRSHNCHPGRGGKTDAIDVGEDHSPQDEIALYGIQTNVTTVATACAKATLRECPHMMNCSLMQWIMVP